MAALKLITPPASEPISLNDEVKPYLRLDGDDFDALLSGLIIAGREYAEAFQNRSYITQTWDLVLDKWPRFPLSLPKTPLVSVESIKYYDENGTEATWAASNYIVDTDSEPGRIALTANGEIPSTVLQPINGVKIRFTCGYGTDEDVPQSVKTALMFYVAHRFEHPDSESIPDAINSLLWPGRIVPV